MLCKNSSQRFQNGAALVEFALILPFLLLLVLGIIEFGYAFYHLNILNKSVENAARYFSSPLRAKDGSVDKPIDIDPATNEYVASTQNLVIYGSIVNTGVALMPPLNGANYKPMPTLSCVNASGIDVTCAPAAPTPPPEHIRVTATYQHEFILQEAIGNFFNFPNLDCAGACINLTASSVMRVE